MAQFAGIVLCGGNSSRMGQPKAWLPIGSETMLQRVVRLVADAVAPVVVVAAADQQLPPLPPEVQIVHDEIPGNGPLQGLAAGLTALQGRAPAAYVSSCDVPFLSPVFIRRMIELLGPEMVAIPRVEGRFHPLAAVYRVEVLAIVLQLLAQDQRRLLAIIDQAPTRIVEEHELRAADPDLQSLRNINSPDDYARALQLLAG